MNNLLKRFLLEGGFDIEVNSDEKESSAQEVKLGVLTDIRMDASVKLLVDNMMTLDVGTSILQIVAACQQEFGMKYPAMIKQPKAWLHLIDNYVKEKTTRYDLQPEETFYWMAAESSEEEKGECLPRCTRRGFDLWECRVYLCCHFHGYPQLDDIISHQYGIQEIRQDSLSYSLWMCQR